MTSILKTAQTIFIACLIRLYSLQLFLMTRPHFLQITNIKDGYFKLQISEKSISKLQCIDLEGAVWECVSITNQNNIIIRIKSKGIVEEYVVESMKIFSKYDRRINCFSSRAGIQIRYLQTDNSVERL